MSVKVYDVSGEVRTHDGDDVEIIDGVLWVTSSAGRNNVAVYAAGKWISADLDAK